MEIDYLKVAVPRGMLFLYDHSADGIEIPAYKPEATIAFSSTAISIATISDFDGDTTIQTTKSYDAINGQLFELFSGQLHLGNGKLSICLMADEEISQIKTKKGNVKLKIYGDKNTFPTTVMIYIDEK